MAIIRPVILSGGSGTRLWPLSQPGLAKQFVPLFDGRSLFSLTLERLDAVADVGDLIVVTGSAHVSLVEEETGGLSPAPTIIVEPQGRDTTAAIIAAALVSDPDDILVVLPSDHLIEDVAAFSEAVDMAVTLAVTGEIVTLGVEPTRPETGYGYIETGRPVDGGFAVARFIEKPNPEEAAAMASDGRHHWNSGMFILRADRALEEVRSRVPGLVEAVARSLPQARTGLIRLEESFAEAESVSFDYSVMEETDRAVVVPLAAGWNDVGSYRSLLEATVTDDLGNHIEGDVTAENLSGSLVVARSRRVVIAGLSDVAVVETPDEVLIVALDRSQDVRRLRKRDANA